MCAYYFLREHLGYEYKLCVRSCPVYTTLSGQCVSECTESEDSSTVLYSQNATCLQKCPVGFRDEQGECAPVDCPEDQPFVEIDGTCSKTCVSRIFREVQMSVANKSVNVCVLECDYYVVRESFSDTEMSRCVPRISCPAQAPLLIADSLQCVTKCPRTKFLLLEARICVAQCPYFHYYNDITWGAVCL